MRHLNLPGVLKEAIAFIQHLHTGGVSNMHLSGFIMILDGMWISDLVDVLLRNREYKGLNILFQIFKPMKKFAWMKQQLRDINVMMSEHFNLADLRSNTTELGGQWDEGKETVIQEDHTLPPDNDDLFVKSILNV